MKNEEFYKRIQIPKRDQCSSVIISSYWLLYVLGNLFVIFLAPVLGKSSRLMLSFHEYWRLWAISAVIILVLNIILSWFIDIRPYLNKRMGFYWRGSFTVIGKKSSFASKYINLKPGNNHRIKVRREFYRSVKERDRISLERTYLGDILKIKKISSGFPERIKRRASHEID